MAANQIKNTKNKTENLGKFERDKTDQAIPFKKKYTVLNGSDIHWKIKNLKWRVV